MEMRFLTLHRLPGVIGLPSQGEFEILPVDGNGARAFLTVEKEKYYLHLRRIAALATMTIDILDPSSGPRLGGTPRERFNRAIARIEIVGSDTDEALLIIEVASQADDDPNLDNLLDLGDFGCGILLFCTEQQSALADVALRHAFAGLALALPEGATDSFSSLGRFVYAIEPDTERLIYCLEMTASLTVTSQVLLDARATASAVKMATGLRSAAGLEHVVRLLSLSASREGGPLMSFLSAWTALELFVQQVFKNTYEPELHGLFHAAAPSSATRFVERMRAVMKDKYNVRDKFVAMAAALNDYEAEDDINTFARLKERRDDIAHSMKIDPSTLPAEEVRNLLRKYLRLHLER